ncbi:hypothetical protein SAMN05192558_11260 [Actinokineospora alba]|uniref:Uncharacterized protein n=1 Tax=Actinokineospora alba TaxID=504798 RepID=A0A1H0UTL3_9PSEU|nr:hypothetical protein [Actinokineospora alba]TDP69068.1 hypothetical protein C8E96_4639 [Actinokineospora alba]SDI78753.1 hypothetical protein SAMN05421871_107344 [Actinokineospora alba]SDP69557.1 hypothetical protein SAMN05192558_11260 [Actinokineospora alba]
MTSYDPDVSASRELTTSSDVPRRRGAINGLLLVLLGAWGAVIPLIGPYLSLAYTPDTAWTFTSNRLVLNILPGLAVLLGGLGLMATNRRGGGVFWGWLAALGGAWFILGPAVSKLWNNGTPATGEPVGSTATQVGAELAFHTGLGALIVFLAAVALGRFTIRERTYETYTAADEAQVDEDPARARLDETRWGEPQPVETQPVEPRSPIDPRTHDVPQPRDVPQRDVLQPHAAQPHAAQPNPAQPTVAQPNVTQRGVPQRDVPQPIDVDEPPNRRRR